MNTNVIYDKEEKIYKIWYFIWVIIEPDVIAYATSEDEIYKIALILYNEN